MKIELLMKNYNKANETIRNMKTRTINHERYPFCEYNIKVEAVYEIEDQLSEQDKLKIIDYHTDGLGSYILELIDIYWKARDNKEIKETTWGGLHESSLKAWVKRNDPRGVLKVFYNKGYPEYYLFGDNFRLNRDHKTPVTDYSYKRLYDGKNIVNQWFHDLLIKLSDEERKYFYENDDTQKKYNKIKELAGEIGQGMILNNQDICDIYYNGKRDGLSDEYLDKIIKSLENIKTYINDNLYDLKSIGDK